MRIPIVSLLLCAVLGCNAPPHPSVASKPQSPFGPATQEQIAEAKHKMHLLREDMTDEQILVTLGLHERWGVGHGGGPAERTWSTYDLFNGHILRIVRKVDWPKTAAYSVSLDEARWSPD